MIRDRQSSGIALGRIERSCECAVSCHERIRLGSTTEGIERVEAFFAGPAFAPHRHDRYAIGLTLRGVQIFRYRGEMWHCLPGQFHILHPDELHDGAPGGDEGFGYRILYVDPALVSEATGAGPLPFAEEPVASFSPKFSRLAVALSEVDQPIDDLSRTEIAVAVSDALLALTRTAPQPRAIDVAAVSKARDCLANSTGPQTMAALERLTGLDRWTLARQFRIAYGTSPYRYWTMRRLECVRRRITAGAPLAAAAAAEGFADQSHMTRQFKRAYGLTPARWAALTRTP